MTGEQVSKWLKILSSFNNDTQDNFRLIYPTRMIGINKNEVFLQAYDQECLKWLQENRFVKKFEKRCLELFGSKVYFTLSQETMR